MADEQNQDTGTQMQEGQTPEQLAAATAATEAAAAAAAAKTNQSSTDLGNEDTSQKTTETPAATDLGAEDDNEGKASEEEAKPYAAFHGPPETDYEEFTLPDGAEADPELQAEFTPLAKELGLSQAGAQKLVEFKSKLDAVQMERWAGHLAKLKQEAQEHPEIGGSKYPVAVAAGRQVMAKFGTPELRKMMNHYGVGAHPEMILFMSRISKAMGETATLGSGDGAGVVEKKPLHEILYKD